MMTAITPIVSTGALPASTKVYKPGRIYADLRVPMREIAVHPTAGEPNVTVYDASGPYSDPLVTIDIAQGLPRMREAWLEARGDTIVYDGRHVLPADNGFA